MFSTIKSKLCPNLKSIESPGEGLGPNELPNLILAMTLLNQGVWRHYDVTSRTQDLTGNFFWPDCKLR